MLTLFGEKILMICCFSKEPDEKQSRALFLDHPVHFRINVVVSCAECQCYCTDVSIKTKQARGIFLYYLSSHSAVHKNKLQ